MSELRVNFRLNGDGLGMNAIHSAMEFNVYDGKLRHVGILKPYGDPLTELKPGPYKITGELPDGTKEEKIIILGDSPQTIEFEYDFGNAGPPMMATSSAPPESGSRNINKQVFAANKVPIHRGITRNFPVPMPVPPPRPQSLAPRLLSVTGAEYEQIGEGHWTFRGHRRDRVSLATFQSGDAKLLVSLPITDSENMPLECDVHLREGPSDRWDVRLDVSPNRPLVRSMLNLLDAGKLTHAGKMAGEARDLLFHKYTDPVGALLGALILFNLGRLDERPLSDWAQNLFNNFNWLTDVSILHVAMNTQSGDYNDADFDRLIEASFKPVIFSEIYSMMVSLLRRWPTELSGDQLAARAAAMARLAPINTRINWSAPTVIVHNIQDSHWLNQD